MEPAMFAKNLNHRLDSQAEDVQDRTADGALSEQLLKGKLVTENCRLNKSLLVKEKLFDDLYKKKSQADAEFDALMSRLDLMEKENAFLKYEYHVLEKELEILNEEMEYNRRSADLLHKQHVRSLNRIAELEAECQKSKNNSPIAQNFLELQNEKLGFAIEQLRSVQEENKTLKGVQNLGLIKDAVEEETLAIVPVLQDYSFDWLQVVVSAISDQKRISNRGFEELLGEIKIALNCTDFKQCELLEENRNLKVEIESLEAEVKHLKESNEMIEDEIEDQRLINEELDTQLTITKSKLNELLQKFSSMEIELDYRNNCCEELEATCLELQLELESVAKKEPAYHIVNQEGRQSQNDWQIKAATVKLAELQETILNLKKQLTAVVPQNINKKPKTRCSLRDQLTAASITEETKNVSFPSGDNSALVIYSPQVNHVSKNEKKDNNLAIVVSKKQGFSFFKRLLMRRKKNSTRRS